MDGSANCRVESFDHLVLLHQFVGDWGSSVWFFWVDGQFIYYIANLTVLVTVTALTLTIVSPFASATILFTAGILLPILVHLTTVSNPLALQISVGMVILFLVQTRYAAIPRQQLLSALETAQRNAGAIYTSVQ